MLEIHASKDKQLLNTLSFRVSDVEFKHLQETLRNYKIHKGSMSDRMRELLRQELWRSRRHARKARDFERKIRDAQDIENRKNAILDLGIEL